MTIPRPTFDVNARILNKASLKELIAGEFGRATQLRDEYLTFQYPGDAERVAQNIQRLANRERLRKRLF